MAGRRSSATPTVLAEENGHLPPVQSMCGTSVHVEVAWLPIAFSADVRMSVEQALRTRRTKLPKGRGGLTCITNKVDMDISTRWASNEYAEQRVFCTARAAGRGQVRAAREARARGAPRGGRCAHHGRHGWVVV